MKHGIHVTIATVITCAIFSCSSVYFWDTLSSILGSASSGTASQQFLADYPPSPDDPPDTSTHKGVSKVALGQSWGMNGWKKAGESGVTLQEAFGIKKGTVKFPSLTAQLPGMVGTAKGGASGASGGSAGAPSNTSDAANAKLGQEMAAAVGWTGVQWTDLNNIVMAESGWDSTISNGGSHGYQPGLAYGIPQALPGSKMASAGADWQTNPRTQIKWMLGYIRSVYGTPQRAWAFHQANGWY